MNVTYAYNKFMVQMKTKNPPNRWTERIDVINLYDKFMSRIYERRCSTETERKFNEEISSVMVELGMIEKTNNWRFYVDNRKGLHDNTGIDMETLEHTLFSNIIKFDDKKLLKISKCYEKITDCVDGNLFGYN